MSCTIEQWTATATGSGSGREITVVGEGECSHSGYRLTLEPTNEGVWDNPEVIALALAIEELEGGAEVITPVKVERTVRDKTATRVEIRTPFGVRGAKVEEA
jgi:hypothetical protein